MKALQSNDIAEFTRLVFAGIESWVKAGEIVARNLDADPEWADKVCVQEPSLSLETVLAFDRIGRGKLHPRLLVSNKPGAVRLRNLPLPLQKRYLEEPVPLLVKSDGKVETLGVSLWNLTPSQCRQVFDKDGVRSEGAQRAWLESHAREAVPVAVADFEVVGRQLVVRQPCKLSRAQIARALADMEA
jgi:hypothetical protein